MPRFDMDRAPLRIGRVTLRVNSLDRVGSFYQDVLGLAVQGSAPGMLELGAGGPALLRLEEDRAAPRLSPAMPGLFHTAFLLPSRADLGAWLRFAMDRAVPLSGAADHLVSEAIYLADPEGNGIEVYADRGTEAWPWKEGLVQMANRPLDRTGLAEAATAPWAGAPPGTIVGHVHLQVGALPEAEAFYTALPGLKLSARYLGGSFFGAGGYHHNLATNVWNSADAPPWDGRTTGLTGLQLLVQPGLLPPGAAGPRPDPWNIPLRLDAA